MNIFLDEKSRLVIPRWRDYRTTQRLDELGSSRVIVQKEIRDRNSLEEIVRDWEENRTISFAYDLVGAAFVLGEYEKAAEAARFLLSGGSIASDVVKEIAKKILGIEDISLAPSIEPEICDPRSHEMQKGLHDLRVHLRGDPRNAIAWADISRIYVILGVRHKATWAMDIALKISPVNRYILRSAARLYLHLGDAEKAHYAVRHAESVKYDPWILAAEISLASKMGLTSRLVNHGKKILEYRRYLPFHTAELASAIGTLELYTGNRKAARKLFRNALIKPNENTVAQASWASRTLKAFELEEKYLEVPFSFEARYYIYCLKREWAKAINETRHWLYDQPFSSRPATQGSYIAAVALENYAESEQIARCGLFANPFSPSLLNNLAFAIANQINRIEEAEEVFSKIKPEGLDTHMKIVWLATKGFILYRQKHPDEGREYYLKAIKMAVDPSLRALAAIYLAQEEKLSNSPLAGDAIKAAEEYCKGLPIPEIEMLLKRVVG